MVISWCANTNTQ